MSLVCSRLPQSDCLFHVVLGMTHPCACVNGLDVTELEFIGRGRVPLVSLVKWLLKIGDRVVSWRGRLMEERETNPSCLPLRCGSGCRLGFLPHSYGGSHSLPLFHARYLDLHLVSDGCSWDFDLWGGNIVHHVNFGLWRQRPGTQTHSNMRRKLVPAKSVTILMIGYSNYAPPDVGGC